MISVTRWFGERRLRAIEHDQGSPLSYLRQMLRVSPAHFFTFIKIMPLARFRRTLPPEAYHLARIVTARHEHGGTCLQMEIRLAQLAGLRLPLLHAVLDESPCALPPELAEVYFFAETVARGSGEEDHWREAIMRRYGELARIIHERFCCNRRFTAATGLWPAGSPLGSSTYCTSTPQILPAPHAGLAT